MPAINKFCLNSGSIVGAANVIQRTTISPQGVFPFSIDNDMEFKGHFAVDSCWETGNIIWIDGSHLIACAENGDYIYTSTDFGSTWTQRTSAGARDWASAASSSDGSILIAADGAPGYIFTSRDFGSTWTQQTSLGLASWEYLASSSDGNTVVATIMMGNAYLLTYNGTSWDKCILKGTGNWFSAAISADGAISYIADSGVSSNGNLYKGS